MKIKQRWIGPTAIAALFCGSLLTWVLIPVKLTPDIADPAIAIINQNTRAVSPFRGAYFEHQGSSLHYVYGGDLTKETVLFVHGFPSYWLSFIRQMEDLSNEYRVVAIDGLGVGRSSAPSNIEDYKLEPMTAHVRALLDHIKGEKVHIVGHDWGAAFAMGFAQRYPGRVRSVIGLSAPPQSVILDLLQSNHSDNEQFDYIERLKRANPILLKLMGIEQKVWKGAYSPLVKDGKLSPEEGALFRLATSNPKRVNAHINWYRANIPSPEKIDNADFWPCKNARITTPVLFIWGTDDNIITPRVISELSSISDKLELLKIPDAGHWPHIERAEMVTTKVRSFITNHREQKARD